MLVVTIRCARLKLWSISEQSDQPTYASSRAAEIPCKVKVIDWSSFSSPSVKVKLRCDDGFVRDIVAD